MKRIWRIGIVFVVLFGLAAIAAEIAIHPSWITIQNIQIEQAANSNENLLFQRIRTALAPEFAQLAGQYVWDVPLSRIQELVAKDKRVRKVSIYRQFPSRLKIVIEPQTPVLAYLGLDNRIYPVAADATLLPPLKLTDAQDLPILRGVEFRDEPALRASALRLFELLPDDGRLRKKDISEIVYSKKDGFQLYFTGLNAEIKIGDSDFGPRLSRAQRVLAYLDSQNIKGRVIDARFDKKVVVRMRNTP